MDRKNRICFFPGGILKKTFAIFARLLMKTTTKGTDMLFISILAQAVTAILAIATIGVIILMAIDFIRNPEWKNDHPLD